MVGKGTITNTFLKTVSAFSNHNGGTILFGVDDDGNVKGLLFCMYYILMRINAKFHIQILNKCA